MDGSASFDGFARAAADYWQQFRGEHASRRGAPAGAWLANMMARKPRMLVAVAQANKTARIVWALLVKKEDYMAPVAAAA